MSRLIVKNLPKGITQEALLSKFSEKGLVTDVQLKYAKDGTFRRFGFVGFKKEEEARAALEFFNNTCIGSARIQVEVCADLGSTNKPRAWSKYSKGTTAYNKLHPEELAAVKKLEEEKKAISKQKKREKKLIQDPKVKEILEKYKDDEMFAEFMETHLGKNNIWSNDVLGGTGDGPAADEETLEELKSNVRNSIPEEELASAKISDFEYLRRKMVKSKLLEDKSPSEETLQSSKERTSTKSEDIKSIVADSKSDTDSGHDSADDDEATEGKGKKKTFFTIKIRGLPYKAKKKDVKEFLQPLKPKSIRVPQKVKSIAYVGFATEQELKQALVKNRSFMGGKRITIVPYDGSKTNEPVGTMNIEQWHDQEDSLKHEETIAESGRIFVRNLSYAVTEEELQDLFSKYGEISEVVMPVDQRTRNRKGFALVTFLLPEHAVRAYSELDGTIFAGRMLHLLPAKSKPSIDELLEQEGLDYKQKKALLQKKLATSPHNWNTLFLGLNALTDIIADTYNTTKEKVLDDSGKGSVAVRLALGETQLVAETKKFLLESGVRLDAFNKPAAQRSKKVILVKNLPSKTQPLELRQLFEPYGVVGRVILPPSGVTGLVEFVESTEAKRAFLKLAYTKFKNLPLYLEWAPAEALAGTGEEGSTPSSEISKERESGVVNESTVSGHDQDVDLEGEEPETDTTLYMKNLSFNTTENDLKNHFKKCGSIANLMIASKPNPKQPGERLSQGYGFIQFYKKTAADNALKTLQNSSLDGHKIELKRSHRTLQAEVIPRKNANQAKQTGTKIMVRNIPFQATREEIIELFKVFGELKAIRLPKKMVGTGSHRGFAFVDFHTKNDAKRAMEALCQSTHLYGRRLVLEWAAADDEDVDTLRKRTAERFCQDEPAAKTLRKSVFDMNSASKGAAGDEDSD